MISQIQELKLYETYIKLVYVTFIHTFIGQLRSVSHVLYTTLLEYMG